MHESTVSLEICKIHTKGLGGRKETLNNQLLYNYVLIFDKSIFLRTNMVNITFFYCARKQGGVYVPARFPPRAEAIHLKIWTRFGGLKFHCSLSQRIAEYLRTWRSTYKQFPSIPILRPKCKNGAMQSVHLLPEKNRSQSFGCAFRYVVQKQLHWGLAPAQGVGDEFPEA